jgi:hypothetical protein
MAWVKLSDAQLLAQRAMVAGGGSFTIHRTAQNWFFDRALVLRQVNAATAEGLRRSGGRIKHFARNSIYRRARPSRPFDPPHRHTGRNSYASLTNIWFAFDPRRRSVVVGSLLIWNKFDPPVPERMEYGYSANNVANPFHRPLRLGGSVPIQQRPTRPRGAARQWNGWVRHDRWIQGTGRLANKQSVWVLWRRARTQAELSLGRRVQEQVWGPPFISYTVAPRPYMQPALRRARPYIAQHFRNTVRAA